MKFLIEGIKGIMIGIANAIPGVSGGTMMVSMGIYDKIIGSVTNLFHDFKKSILTLLPYLIGMAVGIVGLSFSIKFLLGEFPFQTSLLFIGLILGGIPTISAHIRKKKASISEIFVFLLLFLLIIGLQFLNADGGSHNIVLSAPEVVKLFFVGIIAAATMVIPGVSGSMILMILGYYYPIITLVTKFVEAAVSFQTQEIFRIMGILVPFGLGVIVGIFVIAKLIELLLEHFESHTYFGILGLVVASPIIILMSNGIPALNFVTVLTGALAFVAGSAIAFFLGRE